MLAYGRSAEGGWAEKPDHRPDARAPPLAPQGKYGKADRLYLRCIKIQERALGPLHPDLAASLSSRAELLRAQVLNTITSMWSTWPCRLLVSSVLVPVTFLQWVCWFRLMAMTSCRHRGTLRKFGYGSPALLVRLHPQPFFFCQGKLEEADPLLLRAIKIQEKALGPDHPSLAASLGTRALVVQAQARNMYCSKSRNIYYFIYSKSRHSRAFR